jgi:hypothetical protein
MDAHVAVGGAAAGRRWATQELNHAILLRLASEFQGFCRDLHDEAVLALVAAATPNNAQVSQVLALPFRTARRWTEATPNQEALETTSVSWG